MKTTPFLLVLFSFLFLSCSKDDDADSPKIGNYRTIYMGYPTGLMPSQSNPLNLVKLEYNPLGKVSKRWGGLVNVNPNSGFGAMFFDGLYDEITYNGNEIIITKKDTLKNLNVQPDKKIITMEYDKMVSYIRETTTFNTTYDTTWLYYNHYTLFRTVTKDRGTILTKDFFYDNAGNLSEIKSLAIYRYMNDTSYFQSEEFSDYDTAPNPVKHLGIFDETFERSLSQNNYRKYTLKRYASDSSLVWDTSRNWNFVYDENGNVQFDK